MVAVSRKKKMQIGGSVRAPKPDFGRKAKGRVWDKVKTPLKIVTGVTLASPVLLAGVGTGAAAAGVAGTAAFGYGLGKFITKGLYRAPALAVSSVMSLKSRRNLAKKLGFDQITISKKLAKLQSEKQQLDAKHSARIAQYTQNISTGKTPDKKLKSEIDSYNDKAKAILDSITQIHDSQHLQKGEINPMSLEEKIKSEIKSRNGRPLSNSEKVNLALSHSKNSLERSYDAAKKAYTNTRTGAIQSLKEQLDYDGNKQIYENQKAELHKSKVQFIQTQELLKSKMNADPNFVHTDEFQKIKTQLEDHGKIYRNQFAEFTKTSKNINALDKQLKTLIEKSKLTKGSRKDIEFYEGKARTWRNSKNRQKHKIKEDFKDIFRTTARVGSLGLYTPSKRTKKNYGMKSEYSNLSRTDINPFGFKPFTSKLQKIENIKLFKGKTNLTVLNDEITTLQNKIISVNKDNTFVKTFIIPNISANLSPEEANKINEMKTLKSKIDKLIPTSDTYFVDKANLENQYKKSINEYQTAKLKLLISDKSKREKLLVKANLTINDLIDEKSYIENIKKIHQKPIYNDLLKKLLDPSKNKTDLIAELNTQKNLLIKKAKSDPKLSGRIAANDELQIIKNLLRYNEGKKLKEDIDNEIQGVRALQTPKPFVPTLPPKEIINNYKQNITTLKAELDKNNKIFRSNKEKFEMFIQKNYNVENEKYDNFTNELNKEVQVMKKFEKFKTNNITEIQTSEQFIKDLTKEMYLITAQIREARINNPEKLEKLELQNIEINDKIIFYEERIKILGLKNNKIDNIILPQIRADIETIKTNISNLKFTETQKRYDLEKAKIELEKTKQLANAAELIRIQTELNDYLRNNPDYNTIKDFN